MIADVMTDEEKRIFRLLAWRRLILIQSLPDPLPAPQSVVTLQIKPLWTQLQETRCSSAASCLSVLR